MTGHYDDYPELQDNYSDNDSEFSHDSFADVELEDDGETGDVAPPSHASMTEKARHFFHACRWHRKVVLVLLVIALVLGYLIHENKLQPYMTKMSSNEHVHNITTWVRSSQGKGVLLTIAGLIALDLAIDIAYGVWMHKRYPGRLY